MPSPVELSELQSENKEFKITVVSFGIGDLLFGWAEQIYLYEQLEFLLVVFILILFLESSVTLLLETTLWSPDSCAGSGRFDLSKTFLGLNEDNDQGN